MYDFQNFFLKNNKTKLIKKILLSNIFKLTNRNINNISTLFIKDKTRFGNYFKSINNAIIYCELLGCKKILSFIIKVYNYFIKKGFSY